MTTSYVGSGFGVGVGVGVSVGAGVATETVGVGVASAVAGVPNTLTVLIICAAVLAVLLLWRCARPLLKFRREPETWAWLVMPDGNQLPLTHWENILGRAKGCDIVVDFPTVSRTHAVLTRYDYGSHLDRLAVERDCAA